MIFPIDHKTFERVRNSRTPIVEVVDPNPNKVWRYWMTTEGEVVAILGKYLIKFTDEEVDLTVDSSQWTISLLSTEKPKEMILNHLYRGGVVIEDIRNSNFESGLYLLSCPRIGTSYEVWIQVETDYYKCIYLWWKDKMDLLRSLPLIYEMNEFYSEILWKKI